MCVSKYTYLKYSLYVEDPRIVPQLRTSFNSKWVHFVAYLVSRHGYPMEGGGRLVTSWATCLSHDLTIL